MTPWGTPNSSFAGVATRMKPTLGGLVQPRSKREVVAPIAVSGCIPFNELQHLELMRVGVRH